MIDTEDLREYANQIRASGGNADTQAADRLDEAAEAIETLRKQLPESMEHCTIRFIECEHGHGRLTADNWASHGCDACLIAELRWQNRAMIDTLIEVITAFSALEGTFERLKPWLK